jgi:cytochrome c peroxidase
MGYADETASEPVSIGRRLFFDQGFSADGSTSCATCHNPTHAFSDRRPVSTGANGRQGTRNAPGLLEVSRQRSLFWDGRRATLESQALDPLLNPIEHGLPDVDTLLARLRADDRYVQAFRLAYGDGELTAPKVARALAAFQRTLQDGPSPADRFLAGQADALSASAQRGWVLFSGRAGCVRCHRADEAKPLFTDHAFHAVGVGLKRVEHRLAALTLRVVALHADRRAQDHGVLADPDIAALGRFVVTLEPADIGRFKTPALRNVALTAPYMHDGSVATLAEAIELEIYYRNGADGRPLVLTPAEKDELRQFLESLTGWDPKRAAAAGAR